MADNNHIKFPYEGGSATIRYKLSCISEIGIASKPSWVDIVKGPVNTPIDDYIEGYITIEAGKSTVDQGHQEEPIIFYVGSETQACEDVDKEFHISQDGVGCSCNNLTITNFIPSIPSDGLEINTVLAKYSGLDGCVETDYTATLIEGSNKYTVTLSNGDVLLKTEIPEIPSDLIKKEFVLTFYYNETSTCASHTITQLAEMCDCEHVQYFIKSFKRTFSNAGSEGERILIGSGQTDCGGMLARTESEIFGWPSNDLKSEQGENGEFKFYGVVAPNTAGGTRDTGIIFVLTDKDGHEITDGCQSTFQIRQGGTVCRCGMTTIYFSGGRDGEPVYLSNNVKAYSYNQQGDTTFELRGNFGGGGCGAVYIEYDEEFFEGKSYTYHSEHWFRKEDVSFDFKLKKAITEDLIQTITVTEYVDTEFDENNELIVGYNCGTYDETVLIAVNCSCELELGSDKQSSTIPVSSSGGEYTLNLKDKLYCAEDAIPKIVYSSGGEGWATTSEIGGGKWKLTIAPNYLTYTRTLNVKIIPKVNGETCNGENYGYYVYQNEPTITCTCDEKKETIKIKENQHYGTYCSETEIDYIEPAEKENPNCSGIIQYKVLSCIPEAAFSKLTTYIGPGGYMYLKAANNNTSENWVYTVRAYIGDEECGKDFELTIDTCSNVCDCRHRRTEFQFDINPELKACYPKPATEEIITIGTVGEIKDECLAYKVVSSQENVCEPLEITSDNKVQVKLKHFDAPQINIALVVVLYDENTNDECQTTGLGDIKFDIKGNCTED